MKLTHGKVIISLGVMHALLSITPWAFGKQFTFFSHSFFFQISNGLFEFPLLNGIMNYEHFAAFWFFYYGLLLIPLGILVSYVEEQFTVIPANFKWAYLLIILVGVYMIPFSGMTLLMLPHALFMIFSNRKSNQHA